MTAEQLTRDYQDKRLRIEFVDGKTADILVRMVTACSEHESCRGIVYDIIRSDQSELVSDKAAYWTELKYIKNFEVMGAAS